MKPFSLRVLVVRYVVPLHEILSKKPDKLATIVPVSQTSPRPVTLQELKQLVRPLQSLVPGGKALEQASAPAAKLVPKTARTTKTNKTKARQPERPINKPKKVKRSPKKK